MAGAVGPLGARIEPLGPTSFAEARAIFREQIDALLDAGVDLLILETFGNLDELREAVFAAREAAGREMAIVAQVTIDDYGNLPGGTEPETFTRELDEWPVDVIGVNCSVGPKATLETIERMMEFTSKPISAMPNAGVPMRVEGRNIYLCSPEYMAQYARRLLWAGVQHRRRLLRHHPRAHQADPLRGALAAAGAEETGRHGGGAGGQARRPCRKCPWRQNRSWAPSWRPGNLCPSWRFCRRAAWTLRGKSRAPACAPRRASIASTCRTGRGPAPA